MTKTAKVFLKKIRLENTKRNKSNICTFVLKLFYFVFTINLEMFCISI